MRLKLTVRQKITIFILGTAIILFAITIGFFSVTSKRSAYKDITQLTIAHTDHYAIMIENWLNSDMTIVRTLSNSFLEHKQMPFEDWRMLIMGMYKQVMVTNPHVDAIWDSWELSHLDPTWDKPHGRWLHIYYKDKGKLLSKYEKRSLDGDPPVYAVLKAAGKEAIVEPYLSALQTGGLMTSLTSPMYIQGKYVGLVGIDLFLGRFQSLVASIKPYEEGEAFLLSTQGTFIAHPDTAIFSKKLDVVYPDLNEKHKILEKIKRGEKFTFTHTDKNGDRFFYSFSPVLVGRTQTPWSLGFVVPERIILKDANRNYNIGLLVGVIGVALLISIIFILAKNITQPIKQITNLLDQLSKGKIDKSMHYTLNTGDEIAEMGAALSNSIDGLLAKTEFARSIGEGKLDAELNLLSKEDVLGTSLLEMRESLKRAEEEEQKRKIEDEKRRWVNEGLAKFADILRQNNDNMAKLGDEIIKNLVWYLNANLAGLYSKIDENGSITYNLVSAFAYDRKRFLNKQFELGEGLVGTCAAEKQSIYLTDIPQDYIEVTSGLGGTNPNVLLIIPLVIEGDVLGVIELASLKHFENYQIEFVEKLGESIASTLQTVKVNQTTNELLIKSQEQTEMMISQEEEMRQNMEELQATQEEAARKSFEMQGLIEALNASAYVMEYDNKGVIISINDAYSKLLGITREESIGKHHSDNMILTEEQRLHYEEFWSNLRKGRIQKQSTEISMFGKNFTFWETYTPIRDFNGDVYKVLKVAIDITSGSAQMQ
jgi:methyl-accepting chemotaxis protein